MTWPASRFFRYNDARSKCRGLVTSFFLSKLVTKPPPLIRPWAISTKEPACSRLSMTAERNVKILVMISVVK